MWKGSHKRIASRAKTVIEFSMLLVASVWTRTKIQPKYSLAEQFGICLSVYWVTRQDVAKEMEGNLATADFTLFGCSGCSIVSLHFLWGILHTNMVLLIRLNAILISAKISDIFFGRTLCLLFASSAVSTKIELPSMVWRCNWWSGTAKDKSDNRLN